MKLLVFKTDNVDRIITLFDQFGFSHYVDAIHIGDEKYLKTNFVKLPHRLVYLSDKSGNWELDFGEVTEYDTPLTPDFIIYFDEFDELDLSDWFFLQTYFERLFNDLELPMITRRRDFLYKLLLELMKLLGMIGIFL